MKEIITLAHGAGGKAMESLIQHVFVPAFHGVEHAVLEDQARISLRLLADHGDRLAFTTDSYVVDPLFFPGGDIGMLAVNGTINDLAVGGAMPLYMSCAMVLEEGLPIETLQRVVDSMAEAAKAAQVNIVTGDTKVVPRGQCDKLYINTTGIGVIDSGVQISSQRARSGDVIIVNGSIGDHGAAIVSARADLKLEASIRSDTQSLSELVQIMLRACPDIHCMRDATRGGVAAVLNELADASQCTMYVNEKSIPISSDVRGVCEILGFDPLYLANEGKLIAVVPEPVAELVLGAMRQHPSGAGSAIIGQVVDQQGSAVVMETQFGAKRVINRLVGEQFPRIC